MNASKTTNMLIIAIAMVVILIYGKSLIIPFVLALIVWFLIKEIRDLLLKVSFIKKHIPKLVLNILGFLFIFFILGGVVNILAVNIRQLLDVIPQYQDNIDVLTESVQNALGDEVVEEARQFLGNFEYANLLTGLLNSITSVFGQAFLIIIYALFLSSSNTLKNKSIA